MADIIELGSGGLHDQAAARLRTMLGHNANDARALALLARCRFEDNDGKAGLDMARSASTIDPDDPLFDPSRAVMLTGKAGSMTVHHVRTLHGSGPNLSDRARKILFYEIAAAHAWPLLGSGSYFHALGQRKFWEDLKERMITGQPCLQPRVEAVPVRMPLPPAPESGSIFKTQESAGAKSAFARM